MTGHLQCCRSSGRRAVASEKKEKRSKSQKQFCRQAEVRVSETHSAMCDLTRLPSASELIKDSSPATTAEQMMRASRRAFSPGLVG